MDRYHRQLLLPQIGAQGQRRLSASRIVLIGCGALGTVIADQLARAGVGHLTICDRDIVDLTNLQRQTLFDESDAKSGTPKSVAAVARLVKINSTIQIIPRVVDVHSDNIEELCADADIILDGTDNAQTRYLINDVAIKRNIPWVYGAAIATTGRAMGIIPAKSPCLRCLFPGPPSPGELQTCDTAGVLAAASNIVASLQVAETMKILLKDPDAAQNLITFDLWPLRLRAIETTNAKRPECPACGQRNFEFLNRKHAFGATILCGRDTVQVRPPSNSSTIDLPTLAKRLQSLGTVQSTPFFVRLTPTDQQQTITLFQDGRALIHGTSDPTLARSIYARFVGS